MAVPRGALTHSDTGGYTTIKLPPIPGLPLPSYTRDLELLQRGSELSLFTSVASFIFLIATDRPRPNLYVPLNTLP